MSIFYRTGSSTFLKNVRANDTNYVISYDPITSEVTYSNHTLVITKTQIPTFTNISSGATLLGTSNLTVQVMDNTSNEDDSFINIDLPWPIRFNNQNYTRIGFG